MSSFFIKKYTNFFIATILLIQLSIIIYNSKTNNKEIQKRGISVENFSSIIFSNYGITSFGSEKLIKKDENNIYLEGISYMENKTYKIYGKDIKINISEETSSSDQPVEVVNSMGTMNSESFKNQSKIGKIFFIGSSTFKFHE